MIQTSQLNVVHHPLAAHLLAGLRDTQTKPGQFRQLAHALSTILVLEATKNIRTYKTKIRTPLQETEVECIEQGLAVIPILRAGLGMLEPALTLFPDVAVGYIGLERNENTAKASKYYCKLPHLENRYTLCFDPMLATGGSAARAISLIKEHGASEIVMVSVICSPEGLNYLSSQHPDVPIVVAQIDQSLNNQKFIVPGLGDFGNRLYGTM